MDSTSNKRTTKVMLALVALQVSGLAFASDSSPNAMGCADGICVLPADEQELRFSLSNGNWASQVSLPDSGEENALVTVESSAAWDSAIDNAGTSIALTNGSSLTFRRIDGAWREGVQARESVVEANPQSLGCVDAECILPSDMQRIDFSLSDGNWASTVTLPRSASEGSVVAIESSAGWASVVDNTDARLPLKAGYSYLFKRIDGAWSAPPNKVLHTPASLGCMDGAEACQLPTTTAPVTGLEIANGAWVANVYLPDLANDGESVVVRNGASNTVGVYAAGGAGEQIASLGTGEVGRFTRQGGWATANPIRVLFAYSARARSSGGEAKLTSWLDRTNQALEDSAANFYLELAGMVEYELGDSTLAASLDSATNALADETTGLGATRHDLGADVVFYEGAFGASDSGCGLTYTNPGKTMAEVGKQYLLGVLSTSAGCDDNVLPHEVGHLMGLGHYDTDPTEWNSESYAKGSRLVGDLMGLRGDEVSEVLPNYSSPRLYTPAGLRMGDAGADGVKAMNEVSAIVSGMYP